MLDIGYYFSYRQTNCVICGTVLSQKFRECNFMASIYVVFYICCIEHYLDLRNLRSGGTRDIADERRMMSLW